MALSRSRETDELERRPDQRPVGSWTGKLRLGDNGGFAEEKDLAGKLARISAATLGAERRFIGQWPRYQ